MSSSREMIVSHVTDGELHAYLDGALSSLGGSEAERVRAHLEACSTCAERAEQERAVREKSAAVLRDGAPRDIPVPPFEEIRRRAEAVPSADPRPARRGGPPRGWGWAWAASVVLALGLGWAGRGLGWRGAEMDLDGLSDQTVAAERQVSPAPPAAPERSDATADAGPAESVPSAAQERRARAAETVASRFRDDEPATTAAPAEGFSEVTAEAPDEAGVGAPEAELDQVDLAEADRADADFADAGPAPDSAATEMIVARPRLDSIAAASLPARREAVEAKALAAGELQEIAVDAAEETGSLMVPELPVVSVQQVDDALVIRQRLPEGGILELRYLVEEPQAEEGFASGRTGNAPERSVLVLERGRRWLVASAPVPEEALAEWVERIR